MAEQLTTSKDYARAVGVGVATAVILSMVMVPLVLTGVSPFPKPVGLAFAQRILGEVPMPVGLLFHVVYVTFWSVVFVKIFPDRTLQNALWLGIGLWLLVLVSFFPIVGWGFAGMAEGPQLIVASLLPHILFAVVLWGICRWVYK